jgi:hypothetical protein
VTTLAVPRWRASLALVLGCAALGLGCGAPSAPSASASAPLPRGKFARVGARSLDVAQLGASPSAARAEALVHDALFAARARESRPDLVQVVERGVLTRALLESLALRSLAERPATPEERAAVERALWQELDRPAAVRVARVFVPVGPLEDDALVFQHFEALEAATRDAATLDDFAARVQRVAAPDGLARELRVLPPVARDGRVVPVNAYDAGFSSFDPALAEQAHALRYPGARSPVFGTPDGVNLLVAMEYFEPYRAPEDERTRRIASALAEARGRAAVDELRAAARRAASVTVVPHHASLTREAWRDR